MVDLENKTHRIVGTTLMRCQWLALKIERIKNKRGNQI